MSARTRHCGDRDSPDQGLRRATQIPRSRPTDPTFDVAAGYDVLREIENRRRIVQGWQPVGRKIGFTNTTIWSRYGVYQPMWAHIWTHSTHYAKDGHATLALKPFVQPRIEPEVVFRLKTALPPTSDPLGILRCIEWIAPGIRDRPMPFPGLEIRGGGLHRRLRPARRARGRARRSRSPIATARRGRGRPADVQADAAARAVRWSIGASVRTCSASPTHGARASRSGCSAAQPQFPPLAPGEIVTTGTITDAWPVAPGETWASDYGTLGIGGVTLSFS